MAETERRRRRPALSCSLCKRRKIRCDREIPCSNCRRSKKENEPCVYEGLPSLHYGLASKPQPREREHHPSIRPALAGASTPSRQPSAQDAGAGADAESTKSRIRQLEEELSQARQASSSRDAPRTGPGPMPLSHGQHSMGFFGDFQFIDRSNSIMHKTRLFGQSHFISGVALFREMAEMLEPHLREETCKAVSGIRRCKSLARVIKACRTPRWPSPPKPDLPARAVADQLVDCYLRTSESVYRVLHIPTFRRDYEAIWGSETEPNPNVAFRVQLKLVLAIGAATYDEQFSLRASAIQWVYEAQTWCSQPEFKSRLGLQFLQTNLLLLLARESAGVGESMVWISAGALLRTAVYMGLHRDPAHLPKRSTLEAEMRRRLWNTILEITLQASLTSGGPPLVSLDDFDTEPPGNFDDDQLVTEPENQLPKSEGNFTQVSIAIALRKTFPARLAIAKFLNDLASRATYPEVLRLDAELRTAYKGVRRTLHGYISSPGQSPSPSPYQIRVVEFLISRYFSSLHMPFFGAALHEAAYAYSRKAMIDTSLRICRAVCPSSASGSNPDDLARLAVCGSGFYRTVPFQAGYIIAVEVRTQLQEEESLDPVPLRPDLLSVLDDMKDFCLRCHRAGETNMKGYMFMCILTAHIQGLVQGFGKDRLTDLLLKAVEEAAETCLPILEEEAAWAKAQAQAQVHGQPGEPGDGLNQMAFATPPDSMDDWGLTLTMSDADFPFTEMEPMSWLLNDEMAEDLPLW
ncbi:hypothetical protein A1O3_00656 [Capronia epimyces CBS 606.96]|uniref:Zn(2)-C6 fungal-type domain-containing protein n=1 Tax=Capronia epimyces CBS 606.96 TaxID=1182542 RepID=W9YS64_9EURO|nr:uncharacterized protein A1O3_00656 [Capronia epimyces CBS 606.96]EXJ92106.1 hypothetical protein A1O3_00656 [Capronia epimyces CBS 606.96]